MIDAQLELPFDAPPSGAETAPRRPGGTLSNPTTQRCKAADGAPARESVPIPARCPATGGRTCYRGGCHHYRPAGDGGLAGPAARRGPAAADFPPVLLVVAWLVALAVALIVVGVG